MSGLTWLHLSDWHQNGKEFDRQVVVEALLEDIKGREALNPSLAKIDFIVFSGDIAFSGKREEYDAAKEQLFDPLLKATGLNPDRLFIVPGNHDLDRGAFDQVLEGLLDLLKSYDQVKKWLIDETSRAKTLEPFQAFNSFVTGYTGQEQPSYASIREWCIGGKKIALLGINSAWICGRCKDTMGDVNDKGCLLIGEPQIYAPLKKIQDSYIKIAVLHHPLDWLQETDSTDCERHIMDICDIVLHGHRHKPQVTMMNSTSGDCAVIPAGACYDRRIAENPAYANAYNFVHLDFGTGNYTVFLRRWSNPRNEWVEDIDSYPSGKFEFCLRNKLEIPQISNTTPDASKLERVVKLSDVFIQYCNSKNYHTNPKIETYNLRLEISNRVNKPVIVNIYYKKGSIVVQGEPGPLRAEIECLKEQIKNGKDREILSGIEIDQPVNMSYIIILPDLRYDVRTSLGKIGDKITYTDHPDSSTDYRAKIIRDGSTITVTQYFSGRLLLQGKKCKLFHDLCDHIEQLINAPQRDVITRFVPNMDSDMEIINSHLSPDLIRTSENEIKSKLSDAYDYLYEHDKKLITAARCLCISKIPLPEYSPLVMPASKAFEGYVKKLIIDLGLLSREELNKDKIIAFDALIDNSNGKSTICEKGDHVDELLRRLKESINTNRNYMMYSEDSTLHTISNPIHAEDKVNSICVDIRETYDYFKSIGLI